MIPFLFSALILSANPAPAADPVQVPAANPVPAKTVEKPKKERKICRTPLELTGSRMRQRVCRTESEWALREEGRSAEDLKTMGSN